MRGQEKRGQEKGGQEKGGTREGGDKNLLLLKVPLAFGGCEGDLRGIRSVKSTVLRNNQNLGRTLKNECCDCFAKSSQ